jgi:hypothetical protein
VFHDTSMKKLFVVHQEEAVTAFEVRLQCWALHE